MASNSIAPSASWGIDSEPIRARGIIVNNLLYGKTSLRENPCALIGYFSVGILQYGPFKWKRSKPCIFVLEQSRQIQNLQPKQRKKCEYCHFSKRNYRKKLKRIEFFLRFQRWMKKTNILRATSMLSWTSFDAEAETGIAESQETKDDFINQQKSANCLTQTRRRLLIWTLFSATLKLMVWKWENWNLTCVRAWPLFVEICLNARRKNGEE